MAYYQDVAQNLATFDHQEKRRMLEVLAITVVANGRDWRVSGSIPRNEQAGRLSQSSGRGLPGLRHLSAISCCRGTLGDDAPGMPSAVAVRGGVTHHLPPPDPYLSGAVCG